MRVRYLMVGVGALGLAACGGGGSGGGTSGTCTTSSTITITSTGVSPANVCIETGGRVTFANNDTAATHDIEFDSTGCPTVGNIASGSQSSATFPTTATCAYHDGRNATNAAFQGIVGVVAPGAPPPAGGGY